MMQDSSTYFFDTWSRMLGSGGPAASLMRSWHKVAEQQLQSMQVMTDAMSVVARRNSQIAQESWSELMEANKTCMSNPQDVSGNLSTLTRCMSDISTRMLDSNSEASQILSKSFSDAQRGLSSSLQDVAATWRQHSDKMARDLSGFTTLTSQHNPAWWAETAEMFSKGMSEMVENSQSNWWQPMTNVMNGGTVSPMGKPSTSTSKSNGKAGSATVGTVVAATSKSGTSSGSKKKSATGGK